MTVSFTDVRLSEYEKSLLVDMVGKRLDEFIHDKYIATPMTYMSAWLVFQDAVYEVHREVEPHDYFGEVDDVAVVSIRKSNRDGIRSRLVGHALSTDKIARVVKDIKLVEDTQEMINGSDVEHTFSFTAAVIFEFEKTKLMFKFEPWFSEDIGIACGPRVDSGLGSAMEAIPEEDRQWYRASRRIVSLGG